MLLTSLVYFQKELRGEQSPGRKALLYLRCIERALPLRREGTMTNLPNMGFNSQVYRGLEAFFGREALGKFEDEVGGECENLAAAVRSSPSEAEIDEDVIQDLFSLHRFYLDHGIWMLYLEQFGLVDSFWDNRRFYAFADFQAPIANRMGILDGAVRTLPVPTPVAAMLQGVSRELHLEGSPLFSWWDTRSDAQKVKADLEALAQTSQRVGIEAKTAWQSAPAAVKRWDQSFIQHQLLRRQKESLDQKSTAVGRAEGLAVNHYTGHAQVSALGPGQEGVADPLGGMLIYAAFGTAVLGKQLCSPACEIAEWWSEMRRCLPNEADSRLAPYLKKGVYGFADTPQKALFGRTGDKAKVAIAVYPYLALEARPAELVLESGGVDDQGQWTIRARTASLLGLDKLPEGRELRRLSVRAIDDRTLLGSAFSKKREEWELKVSLTEVKRLELLATLYSSEEERSLRNEVLSALLQRVPNDLFHWVLGTEEPETAEETE